MLSAAETEQEMVTGAVAFRGRRDVITVAGPDAAGYLQGQVSQEIEAMPVGTSTWSLVLQPQGKVDGWFRVTRLDDQSFQLDLDAGFGPDVAARLERFKLRTDVTFQLETQPWLAVRGPGAQPPAGAIALAWPGLEGFDLLGNDVPSAESVDVPLGDPEVFEASRIRAGIPAHGSELTTSTIPAEAGIVDASVSFTKGCYVGQELVARVDSRGSNTPRNLAGVVIDGDSVPEIEATLMLEGAVVGTITSAARSPELGPVALAYLKRGVEVPAGVTVTLPDGNAVSATVTALPF